MTFTLDTEILVNQIKQAVTEAMPVTVLSASRMISKAELAKALDISQSGVDQLRRDQIIKGYSIGKGAKCPVRFILDEVIADIKDFNHKKK